MTGKTYTLTKMVEQAAAEYGGGSVMVSSFTTAAAAEVSHRAYSVPEDNIGTLHRFCFEAIGRTPVAEGKKSAIDDFNKFAPAYVMSAGCKDLNSGLEYGDSSSLGDSLMSQATILRNKMIDRGSWPRAVRDFFEVWSSWKRASNFIDYTDMLEMALENCSQAPCSPRIIFVDEAQDSTALQFAVLKRWAQQTEKIVMVGDDDQCIYQFAGAEPEAFASGEITANDQVLEQSYRVPFMVWEHATQWIEKVKERVEKFYYPRDEEGFVKRCPHNFKQGAEIVGLIEKCLLKYSSVMIIGACSYMIEPVKKALLDAGIPFHNPYRLIRADWNPLRLGQGTTFAQRVAAFLKPQTGGELWTPHEIGMWADVLKADGVFERGFKGKLGKEEYLSLCSGEILATFFKPEAFERIMAVDLDWWVHNLVNDTTAAKAKYPLKVIEKMGKGFLDAEEVPPLVTIGTIHSVKGGEADCVILIPDLSQEGMMEWTGAGKSAIRRLMYVGMTRARHGLFICRPASQYCCDV